MIDLEKLTTPVEAAKALRDNNAVLTDAIGKAAQAGNAEQRAAAQKEVEALEEERARIQSHVRDKGWDLSADIG